MIRSNGWYRSALHAVALLAGLVVATTTFAADRAVFQVTDDDVAKWNLVLNNVRNLQNGAGAGTEVEIVAYGPGIQLLKRGSPIAQRITEAVGQNVKVVACQNTMAVVGLAKADMLSDVDYVASGVVEVMRKQQVGYAYIRP